ncbi:hypothetical protein [Gorillibacterium sp. CAU 1737]|uniref:hypothetical protein n=1 Tax=Gorillibacterium sp. CAU 1737 TaxID=3140362 RepID=UPI0032603B83
MRMLLYYQLKQRRNHLLGVLGILVLLELYLLFFPPVRQITEAGVIMLSGTGYIGAFIVFSVESIRSFFQSLKLPSRRLLPLRPVSHVLAALIYGLLGFAVIALLALLHGILLKQAFPRHLLAKLVDPVSFQDFLAGLAIGTWAFLFSVISIYLLIAFIYSFHFKYRVLVAIVGYNLLLTGISRLEEYLFQVEDGGSEIFRMLSIRWGESADMSGVNVSGPSSITHWLSGALLYEIAFGVLFIVATLWLMKNKVERIK